MPSGRAAKLYAGLLGTAAVIVAADQVTKQLALDRLGPHPQGVDLIEGVLTLRLTFNQGGAFGILQGVPGFFLVATIVVVVLILVWAHRLDEQRLAIPLGLVLGGGLGNLGDRLFRDLGGRVVDFIDLHVWPVFNLADSAIVAGVALILILGSRGTRPEREEESAGEENAGR